MTSTATATRHAIATDTIGGRRVLVLSSGEAGVRVAFAPDLAMLACSLQHRGEELLGLRRGLDAYAAHGETMGIPLLYPWANRLGGPGYRFGGREVVLDGGTPRDEHGLPIHGLLAAIRGWRVTDRGAAGDGAWLSAARDASAPADVLEGFPFPHVARVRALLRGAALTIETSVTATGREPVPVSFGYHPYLRLPGVPRADWKVELPVARRLRTDPRGLPTGAREPVAPLDGPLGRRRFDDGYELAPGGRPFALTGGGRRIEVAFGAGYPYAQVFAPCDDDVVCFEPMTAPADALRHTPPAVAPGRTHRARFTISVLA
jgi:aldose 1-epimerase